MKRHAPDVVAIVVVVGCVIVGCVIDDGDHDLDVWVGPGKQQQLGDPKALVYDGEV